MRWEKKETKKEKKVEKVVLNRREVWNRSWVGSGQKEEAGLIGVGWE